MSIDERPVEANVIAETVDGFAISEPASADAPVVVAKAKPVESAERVASVDVIRGVALLGILAMNIVHFAWPEGVYDLPLRDPGAGPLDVALWALNRLIFDTKMMTLFSMLFGAGLVLMSDRAEGRGAKLVWVYYRRVFWLLVIGLIHAYLIWSGDILVMYAACGFFLYPFRKRSPTTLIVIGVCLNLMMVPMFLGFRSYAVPFMRETAQRAEAKLKAGEKPKEWEVGVHDGWKEMTDPETRESFLEEIAAYRASYPEVVKHRAKELIFIHLFGIPLVILWLNGGRMLIGMGLMKLGVFSAALSNRAYSTMMLVGYGTGLPLMIFDIYIQVSHHFFLDRRFDAFLEGWDFILVLGSIPVVFGHIGAVMLIYQSGALPWLTRRLAAVGRMALSNYLFDSIFFTTLFYGYGLDFFGTIHRPMLYVFVVVVWAFQLWISPIWLRYFRFGPAEWLWRSLTYWKFQSMRIRDASEKERRDPRMPSMALE